MTAHPTRRPYHTRPLLPGVTPPAVASPTPSRQRVLRQARHRATDAHEIRQQPGPTGSPANLTWVLADADGHLHIEQIHTEVAKIRPAVNLTTVHRFIAVLLDEHLVHATPTGRGLSYGLATGHRHHAQCRSCGHTSRPGR